MKIREDYVSFEIAKLLEEKGFDEYCRAEWLEYIDGPSKGKTYLAECGSGLQHNSCSNTSLKKFNYDGQMYYAAPTLQMAMKWLREVHKWSIQVFPVFDNLKWCYDIYELKIQKYQSRPELLSDMDYDTYEDACEAAIKYCLTNLI